MKLKKIIYENKAILILISLFFLILLSLVLNNPLLLWDENVYLGNARSHIGESHFIEDFRFPLIEYIIAFFWMFTGESIIIAKFISVFFAVLCLFSFYLILNHFFNNKSLSFIITSLFGFSEIFLFWAFRVYPDILGLNFSLFSILSFIKWLEKNKTIFLILSSFFAVLAFLSRFSYVLLLLSIFIFLIYFFFFNIYKQKNKSSIKTRLKFLFVFILSSFLFILPWIIYNLLVYKNPFWDFFYYQYAISQWTTNQSILLEFQNIWNAVNILILLIIPGIYSLFEIIKNKNKKYLEYTFIFIYFLFSFIYYTFFVKLKDERYVLSFLPIIFIFIHLGILKISSIFKVRLDKFKKIKRKKILKFILSTCFLLFFFSYFLINIPLYEKNLFSPCSFDIQTDENALLQSIQYIESNNLLNKDNLILSNYWPYYAYHFNVYAYSLWDRLDLMIKNYSPSLIIIKEGDGAAYNQNEINSLILENKIKIEQKFEDNCGNKIIIYKVLKS